MTDGVGDGTSTAGGPTVPYVLAVDLGTGGPKVALVSALDGSIPGWEFEPNDLILLPGGGVEQDPDQWWSTIVAAAKRLLDRELVPRRDVVAVAVTSQWMGTVPVDAEGRHLHNAVIWMDGRGARHVQRITRGRINVAGYDPRRLRLWLRHTKGIPSHTGKDSLGHILFLKNERREVYDAAHKFLEPMDYLNLRLTGRFAASYDTITGHWLTDTSDLSLVHYVPELIELAGVDRAKLPDLLPTGAILGELLPEVAADLGLRPDTKVTMGLPDTESAAIGSGAVEDFQAHLYIGTSSWLSCHVPWRRVDPIHTMTSLPSGIPGRFLLATEQDVAGACLTHLVDNVLYPDDALARVGGSVVEAPAELLDTLNEMAAGVEPGSGGVIYLPWLNGEKTPVDDHHLRGGWINMSLATTRAHLVRAVFEGVALNTRWMHKYTSASPNTASTPSTSWAVAPTHRCGRRSWRMCCSVRSAGGPATAGQRARGRLRGRRRPRPPPVVAGLLPGRVQRDLHARHHDERGVRPPFRCVRAPVPEEQGIFADLNAHVYRDGT